MRERPARRFASERNRKTWKIMGALELIIVLAIVLLIFGATQLPKLARSMGRVPHELKKGNEDARSTTTSDIGRRIEARPGVNDGERVVGACLHSRQAMVWVVWDGKLDGAS